MKALMAQIKVEILLTLRRGESLLVSIIIPAALLLIFSTVRLIGPPNKSPVDFYLPATAAVAVIATSMVSLGISTGFERRYGVLKRLGSTPVTRTRLIAAKSASVILIEAGQTVVLILIAWKALGWIPQISYFRVMAALLLGTVAFSGLGLLMAGTLRAEANLAVSNIVFVMLLLVGGVVIPSSNLPNMLSEASMLLPSGPLVRWMDWALNGTVLPSGSVVSLLIWAAAAPAVAASTFRWE